MLFVRRCLYDGIFIILFILFFLFIKVLSGFVQLFVVGIVGWIWLSFWYKVGMGYFCWVGILLVWGLDFGFIFECLYVGEVGIIVYFYMDLSFNIEYGY